MIDGIAGGLLDIETARAMVLERVRPLEAESVAVANAFGRTLEAPVIATERVPGFDNSAMDGWAVIASDLEGASAESPVRLAVADESRAGTPAAGSVQPGQAFAISTGAAVPPGADTVVRVEDTQRTEQEVSISVDVGPGNNIRRAGEDIEVGSTLLEPGDTIGAASVAVIASSGMSEVSCRRRPRVSVLCTGDELVDVGEPMALGQIRNSNAYGLPALVTAAGAELGEVGRVEDTRSGTVAALREGLAGDALVVSGGVSVGPHDHVKPAFAELGVEEIFWRVSLKPGKPVWFGVARDGTLAFGLPGNPVSAFITFLLFVRPALLAMQGAPHQRPRTEAILTAPYEKPADRAHAIRCSLELGPNGWEATPAPHQGSHVMTALIGADAIALIPAAAERIEAGERVTVELLTPPTPL